MTFFGITRLSEPKHIENEQKRPIGISMRAGELRHRITIEQLTEVPKDTFGAPARIWTTFDTRSARVRPLRGKELFDAQQVYPTVDHAIKIRHLSGVTAKMRVSFRGRIFDIKGISNRDERNIENDLMATEAI